jgi:hypothetical protein
MMLFILYFCSSLLFSCLFMYQPVIEIFGEKFPQAEITNDLIQVKFYLPDPELGYYRGTRFDWSGVIHSLKYGGHEYFGQWFDHHDPKIHDAIMGPVEEFRTNGAGLGYDEAKAGETFIRIGVGVVRKPEEPGYRMRHTYDIVDFGEWKVLTGTDWIKFIHLLSDTSGYAYKYTKTIRLIKNKPLLLIKHTLKNTGRRTIETMQYNHNFFCIDGLPTGPDCTVKFPFSLKATNDLKGIAQVYENQLVYLHELEKGQEVGTYIEGFGDTEADYYITIENSKAGAGVKIIGDQPMVKLYFWSVHTTLCPEPFVQIHVEPGGKMEWNIKYEFFTFKGY